LGEGLPDKLCGASRGLIELFCITEPAAHDLLHEPVHARSKFS
jgi:hypothetical protein